MTVTAVAEVFLWAVVAWVACAGIVVAPGLLFREWADWIRWYRR